MRIWEVDSGGDADLVLEQDFILRVRRLQRLGENGLILNFVLNAIGHLESNPAALEGVQKQLEEFARVSKGFYAPMSNGDIFIIWDKPSAPVAIPAIIEAVFPGHHSDADKFLLTYQMPQDYTVLRERTNHYVEMARARALTERGQKSSVSHAQGSLTAKGLDQIDQLLGEIDLNHYVRTQTIFRHQAQGWQPIGEEYFVSLDDMRREKFPRLDLVSGEHFFQSLCAMIDRRLLGRLTTHFELISGRTLNLNLSISTIFDKIFNEFVHRIPKNQRQLIGFELHRGDLLQDFARTLGTIDMLRHEGFRVALDGITPDMARYVDLAAFPVDTIKINVSKDRVLQLAEPSIRRYMEKLPPEKLIFYRCDNDKALAVGKEMGVTVFQGWLVDDLAGAGKSK